MLPAGPQAMRMGAEESEARVVMLHKQGGLFRLIVQNLHEKVSDRLDTRGVEILTPASVGKEFLFGDVPPSPSPVRSLRPGPGDHRRRGRPDRDAPHPHLLVAIAPPNGSRQLTGAEVGLYNTMQVRQARDYVVHRPALRASLALRAALEDFSKAPQPGCPWNQDDKTVSDHASPHAEGQGKLLLYARHQAMLIYVNAYDHLLTLARDLGGDGAMSLFSHASLSRVICEAAIRFAWLMDPGISSEERIMRGAAALYYSADERSKEVRRLPPERFDQRAYNHMLDSYGSCSSL
jgi:hypothetical protein